MSARRVCNGTDPSAVHSLREISAPPRRPETRILQPLAPARIARCRACFIARRQEMRRSIWAAMFSATSWASSSGSLTSTTLIATWRPVMRSRSWRSASTPVPPLPITIPGLPAWMVRRMRLAARSISTREMPASYRRFLMCWRIL